MAPPTPRPVGRGCRRGAPFDGGGCAEAIEGATGAPAPPPPPPAADDVEPRHGADEDDSDVQIVNSTPADNRGDSIKSSGRFKRLLEGSDDGDEAGDVPGREEPLSPRSANLKIVGDSFKTLRGY